MRRAVQLTQRHASFTTSSTTNTRLYSTAHFYQNRQLELYASKEAHRLSLRQLVFYGRSMTQERLIASANYVRTELPTRIAHRIRDLQTLPYVVVTQEGVNKVYELYWEAFEKYRRFPEIKTIADNDAFCDFTRALLDTHRAVIPSLSLGLSLSSPHLPPDHLDAFMRRMLVSRMSRRVLAHHHIALTDAYNGRNASDEGEGHVGVIYTGLSIGKSVRKVARVLREAEGSQQVWPEVVLEGHLDTNFSFIKEHLEYILFELLKNAMQATVAQHGNKPDLPPILVTVVAGADDVSIRISDQGGGLMNPNIGAPSDLFSFSHVRNATRLEDERLDYLRTASTSPSGMVATVEEVVDRWQKENRSRSDPELEAGVGRHPRLGIGLPMSNIFASYFGGSLELVSMNGWGTDVYLRLPKLGTNLEGIEF